MTSVIVGQDAEDDGTFKIKRRGSRKFEGHEGVAESDVRIRVRDAPIYRLKRIVVTRMSVASEWRVERKLMFMNRIVPVIVVGLLVRDLLPIGNSISTIHM